MIPPETLFSDLTPEELRARLARCEAERLDYERWFNDRYVEPVVVPRLQAEIDRLNRLLTWYKRQLREFVSHILRRGK